MSITVGKELGKETKMYFDVEVLAADDDDWLDVSHPALSSHPWEKKQIHQTQSK